MSRGLVRTVTTVKPTTLAEFRRAAEVGFRRANPGLVNVEIMWLESARVPRWADGTAGFRGSFRVSADGYRTSTMYATWCGGLMVR